MSKIPLLLCSVFILTASAFAQLAPVNEKGVAIGHVHLIVKDVDAQKKVWVDVFGAQIAHAGALELLKLPGTIILLTKGDPIGTGLPTADHFGLAVKDLSALKARLAAANIEFSDQSMAILPEGVNVEVVENKNLAVPVAFHHFHLYSADHSLYHWYLDVFGVKFPGGEILFGVNPNPPRVPTKGHVFDHISFEVRNLDEFCRNLEAKGIKLDMGIVEAKQIGLRVTFITDPAGTRIELTEGLAGK